MEQFQGSAIANLVFAGLFVLYKFIDRKFAQIGEGHSYFGLSIDTGSKDFIHTIHKKSKNAQPWA